MAPPKLAHEDADLRSVQLQVCNRALRSAADSGKEVTDEVDERFEEAIQVLSEFSGRSKPHNEESETERSRAKNKASRDPINKKGCYPSSSSPSAPRRPPTPHLTIERTQGWSVLVFPHQQLSFLPTNDLLPSALPLPTPFRKPRRVTINDGAVSLKSTRLWMAYVMLQLAHMRKTASCSSSDNARSTYLNPGLGLANWLRGCDSILPQWVESNRLPHHHPAEPSEDASAVSEKPQVIIDGFKPSIDTNPSTVPLTRVGIPTPLEDVSLSRSR
ncbi:hypothetical protein BJY52DRAFT_1224387 [Lactarius psammicola]|nr:hypothetical protein BJY52DRAFT_1224387 [Lactarius psammicola]